MSLYIFPPAGTKTDTYATWVDGFSEEDIQSYINYGESLTTDKAVVGSGTEDPVIRRTDVAWINLNEKSEQLYSKMAQLGSRLNFDYFGFDLFGFQEDLQYTIYKESDQGHYDWHMDMGHYSRSNIPNRKLSLVLQLSDPSEYEGGFLELMVGGNVVQIEKKKGLLAAFPSYIIHRVTPVTKGIRKTIVAWITGPNFR